MLNKTKGNMYPWVTHRWNPIKGECPHRCSYCYMKRFPQKPLRLDERALQDDLGSGNTIFVGSGTDMWAVTVPDIWIEKVILKCFEFDNTYVFQSKNPDRFQQWKFPEKTLLGTTIESNIAGLFSHAPDPWARAKAMSNLSRDQKIFISIEPVMSFYLAMVFGWINKIKPSFVTIGADTRGSNLPEPTRKELLDLIDGIREAGIEVREKDNLKRLLRGQSC